MTNIRYAFSAIKKIYIQCNEVELPLRKITYLCRPLSVPIRFVPQESHSQAGSTNFCEETYLTSTLGEGLGSFFFHKVCIFY